MILLLAISILSIIPDDAGKDDDFPARGAAFTLAGVVNFSVLLVILINWMGGCGPQSPIPSDPLLPLYGIAPAFVLVLLWWLHGWPRTIVTVVILILNFGGLVAALVRCYKFESGFDFSVVPEDAGVELVDSDAAHDLEFEAERPSGAPADEEALLGGTGR